MEKTFPRLLIAACCLTLPSCAEAECKLPRGWVLARNLKPSPVPYTPNPVFSAQEVASGEWVWNGKKGNLDGLLKDLVVVQSLNPQPHLLFDFTKTVDCDELERVKAQIAKAAHCSADRPCIEGSVAEFQASS
jgi:hypothetical protein